MLRVLFFFLTLFSAAQAQMPPQAVILTAVKEGNLTNQMIGVGTFTSYNDTILKAETSGCIEKIHVKEGASVEEGQKLFSLKAIEAAANVKKAEATAKLAKSNFTRRKKLREKDFISLQDVERTEAEFQAAEAELVLAKEELTKTEICAPFAGVLSMKKVSKGAYVSPGQELIRLQGLDPIRLIFQLPQKDIESFKVGDPVIAKTDAYPDKTFEGKIEAIDCSINETNRSFTLYAAFHNPGNILIPGLYGKIYPQSSAGQGKMLVIPEQALVIQPEGTFVYKKTKDEATLTKITLGTRAADQVEVLSGLQLGDEIVLEGQEKLHNGATIVGTYNVHH